MGPSLKMISDVASWYFNNIYAFFDLSFTVTFLDYSENNDDHQLFEPTVIKNTSIDCSLRAILYFIVSIFPSSQKLLSDTSSWVFSFWKQERSLLLHWCVPMILRTTLRNYDIF